jgi:hypothetical protein
MFREIPNEFSSETVSLDLLGGDVLAFTPSELIGEVSTYTDLYEGRVFFIVGRVLRSSVRPSAFGLGREVVLAGKTDASVAVVGTPYNPTDSCCYRPGQVIYALVSLGALGDARVGRGGSLKRTVYLVTSSGGESGFDEPSIDSIEFPISRIVIGSDAICSRANAVRRP